MKTIDELKKRGSQERTEMATTSQSASLFSDHSTFGQSMQMARALTSSTLVPNDYRGEQNLGNALIALEIAQRTNSSPLMVMQNLYVVHGRPAWSAQFIIAALNSCGRFSPLRFEIVGGKECFAWAEEKGSGKRLEGPVVSVEMAKTEGWYNRNGSKWKTMPDIMLRYRAASFFGKLYAPDILMGMQTQDEIEDSIVVEQETPETEVITDADYQPAESGATYDDGYDEGWPRQVTDQDGKDHWVDSSGEQYDSDLHSWSGRDDMPAVKQDGTFRARRGASLKAKERHRFEDDKTEPTDTRASQEDMESAAEISDSFDGME